MYSLWMDADILECKIITYPINYENPAAAKSSLMKLDFMSVPFLPAVRGDKEIFICK